MNLLSLASGLLALVAVGGLACVLMAGQWQAVPLLLAIGLPAGLLFIWLRVRGTTQRLDADWDDGDAWRRGARPLGWAGPGWWRRWRERSARRRAERRQQGEAADAAEVDRLLAKIGASGLGSLSAGERARLKAISERRRGG